MQPTEMTHFKITSTGTLIFQRVLQIVCIHFCLLSGFIVSVSAQPAIHPQLIAIDPGHGGTDTGAASLDGTLEKDVVLSLARRLETYLTPDYPTLLTRTDDYRVPLADRVSLANHADASVFISLHTAGSRRMQHQGTVIFCHHPVDQLRPAPPATGTADGIQSWDTLQEPHRSDSLALAGYLRDALQSLGFPLPVRLSDIASPLLSAADMPAVIIEVGHLTHPGDRALLIRTATADRIAGALAEGITAFLVDNGNAAP